MVGRNPTDQLNQPGSDIVEVEQRSSAHQEQLTMDQPGTENGNGEDDEIVSYNEERDQNSEKGEKSKETIVLSPIDFDAANLPRPVISSVMISAKTTALSLRVKIIRSLGKCDDQVALLKEIDEDEQSSDHEEEFSDVQIELIASFEKIKGWNEEHNTTF